MYNPNSAKDFCESWSQFASQEWNLGPSSQDVCHKIPSTPVQSRVLPPTPSGSQGNTLSNSWSGRNNSQMTPNSLSQNFNAVRVPAKEVFFSREIRFALHAVMVVMKELPDKLKEVMLKTIESRSSLDDATAQSIERMVEGKITDIEKMLRSPGQKTLSAEDKKLQEMLQKGVDELNKNMSTRDCEVANLRERFDTKTENIKKQICVVRKLYLNESKKLQALLMDLKRNENDKSEMETKIEKTLGELQSLTKASKECSEELFQLFQDKEDKDVGALSSVMKELISIKTFLQALPSLISSSIKETLGEYDFLSPSKQNVRIASKAVVPYFAKKQPSCSPVARVLPQLKQNENFCQLRQNDQLQSMQIREEPKCVLDIIDHKTRLNVSAPSPCKKLEEENSDQTSNISYPFSSSSRRKILSREVLQPLPCNLLPPAATKRPRMSHCCSDDHLRPQQQFSDSTPLSEINFSRSISRQRTFF